MTTDTAPVAVRKLACYYEFPRPEGWKVTAEKGNLKIDDPDDVEWWDDKFTKAPYNNDPRGALVIEEQTIVDGEVVKRRAIKGGPCHMNRARETLYEFRRLVKEGSKTPWDQDRTFRDMIADAEKMRNEGREKELGLIREALLTLTQRPQVTEVSSGSAVTGPPDASDKKVSK